MANEQNIKIEQVPVPPVAEKEVYFNKEDTPETIGEHTLEIIEENKAAPKSVSVVAAALPIKKEDDVVSYSQKRGIAIDNILSEGLEETFLAMAPDKQKVFKKEGEETVKKINTLLDATKINFNKIALLIRRWLRLIPGINRFFLDQEAKIKTDKILKIKNKI